MKNDLRKKLRRITFENKCYSKWGNEFQSFFEALIQRRYPNFVIIRPIGQEGDWKCDGFEEAEETLYQVYAPISPKDKKALEKLEKDFVGAYNRWHFKKWIFIYGAQSSNNDLYSKAGELSNQYNVQLEVQNYDYLWNLLQELPPNEQDEVLSISIEEEGSIRAILNQIHSTLTSVFRERISSRFTPLTQLIPDSDDHPRPLRHGGLHLVDFVSGAVLWRENPLDIIMHNLIIDSSDRPFLSAIISGPTGSGKTTSALHFGYELVQKGWEVYYAEASELLGQDQETVDIFNSKKENTLLIIDNININPRTIRFLINGFSQSVVRGEKAALLRLLLVNRSSEIRPSDSELLSLLRLVDFKSTISVNPETLQKLFLMIESFLGMRIDIEFSIDQLNYELPLVSEMVDQQLRVGTFDRGKLSEFALERRLEGISNQALKTGELTIIIVSIFARMFCMISYRFLHKILSELKLNYIDSVLESIIDKGFLRKEIINDELLLSTTHQSIACLILENAENRFVETIQTHDSSIASISTAEEYLVSKYLRQYPPDFNRFLLNLTSFITFYDRMNMGPSVFDSLHLSAIKDKESAMGLSNLGSILHRTEINDKAETAFRKAIELDSTFSEVWSNLGLLLNTMEKIESAEEAMRTAISLNPESPLLWSNLALIQLHADDVSGARESHEKAIEIGDEFGIIWMNYGSFLHECNESKKAEEAFRRSLDLDPELFDAWYNLGIILHKTGRIEEAMESFSNAFKLNPTDVEALYNYARILQGIDKLDEAEAIYRGLLAIDSEFSPALTNLGALLVDRGDLIEAEVVYKDVIRTNPENEIAWYNMGKMLEELGRLEEAEEANKMAIQLNPTYTEAWTNLAVLYERQQKYADSRKAYLKALKTDETSPSIWYNYGVLLRKTGDLQKSIDANERALKLDSNLQDAKHNLAVVLSEIGRHDDAKKQYEAALKTDQSSNVLWTDYAVTLGRLGLLDEGIKAVRKAIELDKNSSKAWFTYGTLLKRMSFLDDAEGALTQATQLESNFPEAWLNLGNILIQKRNLEEALKAYQKAIENKADYARAWSYLGTVYMLMGKFTEAEESMRTSIEFDSLLPEAWINLSALLKRMGRTKESTEAYLKGRSLASSI